MCENTAQMVRTFWLPLALVICVAPAPAASQLDQSSLLDIQKVEAEALRNPSPYQLLETLSDDIGPRLTGSPSEATARAWALREMRRIGLSNVHDETWRLQRGWSRGYAHAELVSPFHLGLTVASYGWSGSTPKGGVEGSVVLVDSGALDQVLREPPAAWAGKILLLLPRDASHFDVLGSLSHFSNLLSAARKAHAVAVIASDMRPGVLLPHTGPASFSGGWTDLPVLDLVSEQRLMLARILATGKPVQLRVDVQNRFTDTPLHSANVVGEVPGTGHPAEVVMIAAHLDSWDLGTGTTDDAFGVAAVLGAAKAIIAAGARPKRTLRFVLYTGEEQGMLGSRAYVTRHLAELPDMVAVLAMDWGCGPITRVPLAGHEEFAAPLQELFQSNDLFKDVSAPKGYLTFTDAYAFTMAGVAGLALFQDSPDYTMIGHSGADTFDKVSRPTLERDTAMLAVASLWISDYQRRIGTQWSPEQMTEFRQRQRVLLQVLGEVP